MNNPFKPVPQRERVAPATVRVGETYGAEDGVSPATLADYDAALAEARYRFKVWTHLVARRTILRATAPSRRAEARSDALARIHVALARYRYAAAHVLEIEHRIAEEARRASHPLAQTLAA